MRRETTVDDRKSDDLAVKPVGSAVNRLSALIPYPLSHLANQILICTTAGHRRKAVDACW